MKEWKFACTRARELIAEINSAPTLGEEINNHGLEGNDAGLLETLKTNASNDQNGNGSPYPAEKGSNVNNGEGVDEGKEIGEPDGALDGASDGDANPAELANQNPFSDKSNKDPKAPTIKGAVQIGAPITTKKEQEEKSHKDTDYDVGNYDHEKDDKNDTVAINNIKASLRKNPKQVLKYPPADKNVGKKKGQKNENHHWVN